MFRAKLSLFLIILIVAAPALLSANNSNIESVIDEADKSGISVVYDAKGRTLPFLFNPLAAIITKMTVSTALKLGLLYTVGVWLLSTFFPQALVAIGLTNSFLARGARTTFDFDYEAAYASLNTLSNKMSTFLNIPESECRYRAVCETSTYIATKVPSMNEWAKKVSGAFFLNLANPYSRAWINGMMQIDCPTTYSQCSESPYKTVLNKIVAKRR